ncbi:nucleic acid-binding protein [Clostridium sp. E02]|uniref:nucleic acid-binding protein n=1 Tax=Clostridium sp. E02 TaxID=2487134 RepID=UPI000F537421|nr:nucleic acid-binding protein [Clostridium sp. E02]
MKKCLRCNEKMIEDLSSKANGGGYQIIVKINKNLSTETISDLKVAVCPKCGYVETYISDLETIKKLQKQIL